MLTPIMVIIPGVLAYQIFGGAIENTDTVYPLLVNTVLPAPLIGFFAAGMMGAILSTFNSVLNSVSTLFALNIYKPKFGQGKSDIELVKVGKIFGLIIAVIGMIGAPFIMYAPTGLYDYLQTINGFFNVPIFTIIFMGYMTKKVPPIAAKVAVTFFVTVYGFTQLVWDTGLHYLHVSAILFVISCFIMYVIGKLRPNEVDFVLEDNKLVDIQPWKNRYRASGFVIFVMIGMYVIFSKLGIAHEDGIRMITWLALAMVAVLCAIGTILFEKLEQKKK